MGGFVNGIILIAMAIFIALQAIPQFVIANKVTESNYNGSSWAYIAVAGTGIILNILGVTLFADTHSHGGKVCDHGHSHKGKGNAEHAHSHDKSVNANHQNNVDYDHTHEHLIDTTATVCENRENQIILDVNLDSRVNHNQWGLFVHFLGDVLTSLLVLGVGLINHYFPVSDHNRPSWVVFADPFASLLSVIVILVSVRGLLTSCTAILLQSAPAHVDLDTISNSINALPGILGVHDFHVWQLADGITVASLHAEIESDSFTQFPQLVERVRVILHRYGIHSSTVQPDLRGQGCGSVEGNNCVTGCEEESCCNSRTLS